MFRSTHSFTTGQKALELKSRLLGDHVMIHNVDFEILEEEDDTVSIVAHTEQIEEVKTLPDTTVYINEVNGHTQVRISSVVREFDRGVPMLVMIVIFLVFAAAAVLYFVFHLLLAAYIVAGVGALITLLFIYRMQTGYFDYVKKVRDYIKAKSTLN